MPLPKLPVSLGTRLTSYIVFVCLIASVLAGAADTKW
jgi:hypothetical protein